MEPVGEATPLTDPAEEVGTSGADGEDDEECGWCKWMKAGGCKPEFQVWLDCVDAVKAAGRDDVESCSSVMGPLWECMERHKDYYAPQLSSLGDRKKGAAEGDEEGAEGEAREAEGKAEGAAGGAPAAAVAVGGEGVTVR